MCIFNITGVDFRFTSYCFFLLNFQENCLQCDSYYLNKKKFFYSVRWTRVSPHTKEGLQHFKTYIYVVHTYTVLYDSKRCKVQINPDLLGVGSILYCTVHMKCMENNSTTVGSNIGITIQ